MAGTAAGQAAVEYGLGAGRAATSTAPAAKGIGSTISGLADSLERMVNGGKKGSDPEPVATPAPNKAAKKSPAAAKARAVAVVTAPPPAPKPNWEDPSGIRTGISYAELVRRFGPPALAITDEDGRTLTYAGTSGSVQLQVEDGQVTSVVKPRS
jgi:hypothetical protein